MDLLQTSPAPRQPAPAWNLYGEEKAFPDVLHIERISDRAAGLDWVIAPHRHLHLHQFFLLRAGMAEFTADGHKMQLAPPVLLSVPAGVIHGFTFSAGTDGHVLTIPLPNFPDVLGPASPFAGALGRVAVLEISDLIYNIFLEIEREYDIGLLGRSVALRALATQIICAAMRSVPDQNTATISANPRFVQFQNLLQTHLRDGWGLARYAQALGISERHLTRLCRAATAQTAANLIEAAVMREACRLLVYTRMSVATVGYTLGFEDPSYFSRAFLRVIGRRPLAYRAGFNGG